MKGDSNMSNTEIRELANFMARHTVGEKDLRIKAQKLQKSYDKLHPRKETKPIPKPKPVSKKVVRKIIRRRPGERR